MPPRLSIVIPCFNDAATVVGCLESVVAQCDETVEVIVVDSGGDGSADRISERFPEVTLFRSSQRLYPGGARNLGVQHSSGEILGFIDADCVADPRWVSQLLSAHDKQAHVAIGGVIDVAEANSGIDWAAYFCSFYNWLPGTPNGEVSDIPTCCLSVQRAAFERIGPFRETGFSSDTEFNWRLVQAGHSIYLDSTVRVGHIHHPGWSGFVRRQFERGRAFAQMRQSAETFPLARRALYLVGSPLIAVRFTARLLRLVRREATPRELQRGLVRAWPVVVLGYALWAAGEAAGYFTGPRSR
jgi:GT2 family glycosyltransferase